MQLLEDIARHNDLCPVCGTPWHQAMTIFDGPDTMILQCVGCEEQLETKKPEDDDDDEDEEEDADRK